MYVRKGVTLMRTGRGARTVAAAGALVGGLALGLVGCAAHADGGAPSGDGGVRAVSEAGPREDQTTNRDDGVARPRVLATFTVVADIVANVAGEHAEVVSLMVPGAEVHGYEPTPTDVARARDADLVLEVGLGLETWFEQFVDRADVPHAVLSDGITLIDVPGGDGVINPHVWMSPREGRVLVDNAVAALSHVDPAHADDYAENGAAYAAELVRLEGELAAALANLPREHRVLVTCEGAFSYLARDADLEERYLWAVSSEQQARPRTMARAVDLVRERGVPTVFCESTVSDATMRRVAAAAGAELGGTLYVDSLSGPDGPVPTYLDLLRHDIDVVVAGLTRAGTGAP